jgi:HPt (histidine-containing phosphotransfer) domain-containing protein
MPTGIKFLDSGSRHAFLELCFKSGMLDFLEKSFKEKVAQAEREEAEEQKAANSPVSYIDEALLNELIADFVKENKDRFKEILNAIESKDIKLAHRLAHTLKSNAGSLGKFNLQKAAAEVESHLKDGENLLKPEYIKRLEIELKNTLEEFAALLK